jgi:hypothetical protein
MTVILKVNMKNLEWDICLCKCYISLLYLKVNKKNLVETNVFVNLTPQYDCYSQSKYESLEW